MICQINNWLYQGDINSIKDKQFIGKNIKGIVFLGENNEKIFPNYADDVCYLWAPFNDPGENLTVKKVESIVGFACDFKTEGGVLIACYGGVNRSSAMCAVVLHYSDGLKEKNACELVKKRNSAACMRKELTISIKNIIGLDISI